MAISNSFPINPVILDQDLFLGTQSNGGKTVNYTAKSISNYINASVAAPGAILHATASGTDTYTATISGVTAYADGEAYLIRFTNGNTTGCTLNINALGAVPLYRNNDGAVIGGDIWAGSEMLCVYNSTLNIFQCIGTTSNSLFSYVTNADTVSITKGQPVYAFGGTGDRLTVKRAFNTTDAGSARTIGVVLSSSIGVNQKGIIIIEGLLDGLNILPTATWSDGDTVYLGATAGSITNIKPYAPNHLVYLGTVTTASNGSSGRWYVKVQNGYELDELHNVQAQSPSLKDTLWYDNTVSPAQWKTASISTILGYTPFQLPALTSGSVLFSNGTTIAQDNANLFWNDANNRLGIGTNTPSAALHVIGNMVLNNYAGGVETITFSNGPQIEANGPAGYFKSGNVFTNTTTSNVGIGISSPLSTKLTVNGDGRFTGAVTIGSGYALSFADIGSASYAWIEASSYDPVYSFMSFTTGGTEKMRITSTGNVGIGTSTPNASALLEVNSTTKGFLPPKMTTAQKNAIPSPTAGLIVYDTTTNKACCYNGTTWNDLF